jgi:luciferase family oxidoreductase group 1
MNTPSRQVDLSVLDLCPILSGKSAGESLQNTVELAQFVETLGYRRYWMAEHHNMLGIGSSSPEVLIAHVAQLTKTIRVGSGGIMLPNHASLRIAEAFRTLEALHPGRIDLGLGRAPGTGSRAAIALRVSEERMRADHFPEQFDDLTYFLTDEFPDHHHYRQVVAMPKTPGIPELWMLGSSDFGARFAAEKGLPYAFAQHFSPLPAKEVIELYRKSFKPSRWLQKPRAILATAVVCADSDEEAQELALSTELSFFLFRQTGHSQPLPTVAEAKAYPFNEQDWQLVHSSSRPKFVGSLKTLKKSLGSFVEDVGADELMALTMVYDQQARKHSYELLSQLFKLN